MSTTRTFSIIKPDATRRNLTGAVTKLIEEAGPARRRVQAHQDDPRAGRRLLCRARRAPVLRRPRQLHGLGPGRGAGARGRGRGEAQPRRHGRHQSRRTPMPAPSARSSPNRSRRTRCTARTAKRTPRPRSPTSSRPKRSSAKQPILAIGRASRHIRGGSPGGRLRRANLVRSGRKQPQRVAAGRSAPFSARSSVKIADRLCGSPLPISRRASNRMRLPLT